MAHDPALDTDRSPSVFEQAYAAPGSDFDRIPWARLAPRPELLDWLDGQEDLAGKSALVVGCGLGDDAEELSRRGLLVTAFDLSPSAISWCRQRFPDSEVRYRVGDVFDLGWTAPGFDVVIEIFTIQSIDPDVRAAAVAQIGSTVGPGGLLFWFCLGRDDDAVVDERPWPLRRAELEPLTGVGLVCDWFSDEATGEPGWRRFLIQYHRPTP